MQDLSDPDLSGGGDQRRWRRGGGPRPPLAGAPWRCASHPAGL